MKKIVYGKKYDTETATVIGKWTCDTGGRAEDDFHYFEQTLYRKKTGEYFLFAEGMRRTDYDWNLLCPEGWGAGYNITPMTEGVAKDWVMEHLDCDVYESIWGEVEE